MFISWLHHIYGYIRGVVHVTSIHGCKKGCGYHSRDFGLACIQNQEFWVNLPALFLVRQFFTSSGDLFYGGKASIALSARQQELIRDPKSAQRETSLICASVEALVKGFAPSKKRPSFVASPHSDKVVSPFILPYVAMASNSQKGKNSEEYKVVKKHFRSIITCIKRGLPVLANELFSRDFISEFEYDNAVNINQPVYTRASVMIMSILTKIENDVSFYSNFVSALTVSGFKDVAAVLESSPSNENFCCSTFPHAIAGKYMLV